MAFKVGRVVAFKHYGDKRFPKAIQYHRVTRVEGRGPMAQVYTEDCETICKGVESFFLAEDLRKLRKRERDEQ